MMKLCIFLLSLGVVMVVSVEVSNRPKKCAVGTTYTKDCNTCTCGDSPANDKCSKFDCDRQKTSTTPRTPSQSRPGVCPTVVTPAPGSTDCANRKKTSVCEVDKDCPGAKKCCKDGCGINLCRNAIYANP